MRLHLAHMAAAAAVNGAADGSAANQQHWALGCKLTKAMQLSHALSILQMHNAEQLL